MGDGNSPKPGDTVKVHYVLRLTDGKQLESSYEVGEPIEFVLGEGRVIPGWDKGILLMSKGEKVLCIYRFIWHTVLPVVVLSLLSQLWNLMLN